MSVSVHVSVSVSVPVPVPVPVPVSVSVSVSRVSLSCQSDNSPQVMVTESSAQYQQTGNCLSDAAQLTHPISSAEDVNMQPNPATPCPDTHDIATP